MYVADLVELLCAAHLSAHVVDGDYRERGGIMLVAPPGALKSSLVDTLGLHYSDATVLTDLNAKAIAAMRERIVGGEINTLVFPEYPKLYERKSETTQNLEGTLRALTAEGFRSAAFEAQGVTRLTARAMVIGAMTMTFRDEHIERWQRNGFARRFLWPLFVLDDPEQLVRAFLLWKRLDFRIKHLPQRPAVRSSIPMHVSEAERQHFRMLVKFQPGGSSIAQAVLVTKMYAVLKWWYNMAGRQRDPMEPIEALGDALGPEGGRLVLDPVPDTPQLRQRERARVRSQAGRELAKARKRKTTKRRKRK